MKITPLQLQEHLDLWAHRLTLVSQELSNPSPALLARAESIRDSAKVAGPHLNDLISELTAKAEEAKAKAEAAAQDAKEPAKPAARAPATRKTAKAEAAATK